MNYLALITAIADTHRQTQVGAAGAVNRHHLVRNWLIGAYLVEFEQNGEDRAAYGEQLLPRLATDLSARDVPGCSREMLGRMRLFFEAYPQFQEVIRSSPLTEFRRLPGAVGAIRSSLMTECAMSAPNAPAVRTLRPELLLRFSWTHLNPPVGLILCTDKDRTKVEYATGGLERQVFVSRYLVALPAPEQLEALLDADLSHWEQTHPSPTTE
jgi:hypothetical protein